MVMFGVAAGAQVCLALEATFGAWTAGSVFEAGVSDVGNVLADCDVHEDGDEQGTHLELLEAGTFKDLCS